jgi:hypothetical protein
MIWADGQVAALKGSKMVYVGNLSFYTSEAQIIQARRRCRQSHHCLASPCRRRRPSRAVALGRALIASNRTRRARRMSRPMERQARAG